MTARVRQYIAEASDRHKVDPALVAGRCRRKHVVHARFEVMRRLRADGFSTLQIGRMLDRDHSTIVHGLAVAAPGLWFA